METAIAEKEIVRGGVIESGVADKGVADKIRVALEKERNSGLERGEVGKVFIEERVIGSGGIVERKDVERDTECVGDNAETVGVSEGAVDIGEVDGAIGG